MKPFKIQMKFGENEFSAEGDEASVKEQLAQFMSLLNKVPSIPPRQAHQSRPAHKAEDKNRGEINMPSATPQGIPTHAPSGEGIPENTRKLFLIENDELTLRVPPAQKNGDKVQVARDAFIALMYGQRKIKGIEDTGAPLIVTALRHSGITFNRLDRAVADFVKEGIITKTGIRKGVRYRLTNKGMQAAEQVIGELEQRL